jgi:serine/threonine protein kinase
MHTPCMHAGREIYTFSKVLGKGNFGVVHLVHSKKDGTPYACKSISKRKDVEADLPNAPGHNSLLPWSPEVLQTPIDAEWSQLSIALGRGTIGGVSGVVDKVTDPYRLRLASGVDVLFHHSFFFRCDNTRR